MYEKSDVVKIISLPKKVTSREIFDVPEMANFISDFNYLTMFSVCLLSNIIQKLSTLCYILKVCEFILIYFKLFIHYLFRF